MDISTYEPLNNMPNPQVDRPDEELSNDSWEETFPNNDQQTAAIQLQPISDISHRQVRAQIHDPCSSEWTNISQTILDNDQSYNNTECISISSSDVNTVTPNNVAHPPVLNVYLDHLDETASAHGDEYDIIDEYDYIPVSHQPRNTEEKECGLHNQTNRPLPVIPLSLYEPLNTNADISNGRRIASRRICILITKIFLILTALVAVFVTGGVITMLLAKVVDHKGKLFVHCFVSNIVH